MLRILALVLLPDVLDVNENISQRPVFLLYFDVSACAHISRKKRAFFHREDPYFDNQLAILPKWQFIGRLFDYFRCTKLAYYNSSDNTLGCATLVKFVVTMARPEYLCMYFLIYGLFFSLFG